MIYKLIAGRDPKELNEGLLAVEEFSRLTDKQLFFVLLVADPSKDNPIKTLSGRERREKAAILAGYLMEPDGKRLAKNTRSLVYGDVPNVEEAIIKFKDLHYSQTQHNKEALKKQITEIREFLESDKRIPLLSNGKLVLDKTGKEVYITDQKALKLAVELGVKLPELEKALNELELFSPEDLKFEGLTATVDDIPSEMMEEGGENLSTIEKFHAANKNK